MELNNVQARLGAISFAAKAEPELAPRPAAHALTPS
jgi:hypothetical protein